MARTALSKENRFYAAVAENLRMYRSQSGLSREQLAACVNRKGRQQLMTPGTIADWEAGLERLDDSHLAILLANSLGISLSLLIATE